MEWTVDNGEILTLSGDCPAGSLWHNLAHYIMKAMGSSIALKP